MKSMSGALSGTYLNEESLLLDSGEKLRKDAPIEMKAPKPSPQRVMTGNKTVKTIQKLPGRDEHGLFKDHKTFVKVRNQINSQEEQYQGMYSAILDKVQNNEYLQQAILIQNGEQVNLGNTQLINIS
jgi:hypothetical protein